MELSFERVLDRTFARLFDVLRTADYAWETLSPEQESAFTGSDALTPLARQFGLGHEVSASELEKSGISEDLQRDLGPLRLSVSRIGRYFVPHARWRDQARCPVYLGPESLELARLLEARAGSLSNLNILDLGGGSGALSFVLSGIAKSVLGLEVSARSVEWAGAAARAQGIANARFVEARIGDSDADRAAENAAAWDAAVFNPPMAISAESDRPHRDGGALGVEIPLLFMEYARRHLRPQGEVFCLVTNPIIQGRAELFHRIDSRNWEIVEQKRLHTDFNRSLFRQDGYGRLGVDRIELWFLRLAKRR